MKRLMLLIILISLFMFTGCSNSSIAIIDGEIDVNLQDQTTDTIDIRVYRKIGDDYILNGNTLIDSYNINLVDSTGLTVGNKIGISQNSDNPGTLFAYITAITGNTITLNIPTDIIYSSTNNEAVLFRIENNIGSSDGSVTRVLYSLPNDASIPIDITRLNFKMVTTAHASLNLFGDLPTLTNGLLIRNI